MSTPEPEAVFPVNATRTYVHGQQRVDESLKDRFGEWVDRRTELGTEKYGQPLYTFDGRDTGLDMTEEILDFTQYQEKHRLELIAENRALKQRVAELEQLSVRVPFGKELVIRSGYSCHGDPTHTIYHRLEDCDQPDPAVVTQVTRPCGHHIIVPYNDVLFIGVLAWECRICNPLYIERVEVMDDESTEH